MFGDHMHHGQCDVPLYRCSALVILRLTTEDFPQEHASLHARHTNLCRTSERQAASGFAPEQKKTA